MTICSLAVVFNSGCKCKCTFTFTHAMAKTFSRRPRSAEVRVRSQTSPRGICGSQSTIGTGLYPITSVSPSSCLSSSSTTLWPRRTERDTCQTCGFLSNVAEHGQKIAFTQALEGRACIVNVNSRHHILCSAAVTFLKQTAFRKNRIVITIYSVRI